MEEWDLLFSLITYFFEFLSPFVEFIGIFILIYSYFYDPVAFMNILYFIIAVISFLYRIKLLCCF